MEAKIIPWENGRHGHRGAGLGLLSVFLWPRGASASPPGTRTPGPTSPDRRVSSGGDGPRHAVGAHYHGQPLEHQLCAGSVVDGKTDPATPRLPASHCSEPVNMWPYVLG